MALLPEDFKPSTTAEAILVRLKQHEVDFLFCNAGTDFAPVIEIYSKNQQAGEPLPIPTPFIAPHENAAVSMAHGYYLATGKPQAVMVHVNVGLANALMGIINAASDNVPIFMMAGRTPGTEQKRLGARSLPIHWGQDMRDQSAIVREFVKWEYELKLPDQAPDLIDRGYAIAMSHPRGPVYLGLPREPLSMDWPEGLAFGENRHAVSSPPAPDPQVIAEAARLIKEAARPLIISQRSDPEGKLGKVASAFAEAFAIPFVDFWTTGNVMATDHPMHMGFDPAGLIEDADLIITLDALVPWLEGMAGPNDKATIIQIGADPLFSRMPIRGFRADLNITAQPASALALLHTVLSGQTDGFSHNIETRRTDVTEKSAARRENADAKARDGDRNPMTPAFVSKTLSDLLPDSARIFSELGCDPSFMRFEAANHYHSHALAGGLGWGVPAALGACLADPERLTVACVGDGSYMFANPVACHQIAEAHNLPLLTIVFNNSVWNAVRKTTLMMYPDGYSSKMNTVPMSSLDPNPDFTKIAEASRGWARKVETGSELREALKEALHVVKSEGRQALIDVVVTKG